MMTETNLPPEVAEALGMIGDLHPHGIPTVEGLAAYRATRTLRDYLLQVTAERDELQSIIDGQRDTMGSLKRKLAVAEMERDALRARIDGAPVVTLRLGGYGWLEMCDPDSGDLADLPDGMKGKHVRLVVEDDNA